MDTTEIKKCACGRKHQGKGKYCAACRTRRWEKIGKVLSGAGKVVIAVGGLVITTVVGKKVAAHNETT